MRNTTAFVKALLACMGSLLLIGRLAGQPIDLPPEEAPPPASKPVVFKGEAKFSAHSYKMEKGNTYRITAKAEAFVPQVRIPGQISGTFPNPGGFPFSDPPGSPPPGPNLGRNTAQMFFVPQTTKEYSIRVEMAPGIDVGKGPHPYTLTIERAIFKPHVVFDNPRLDVTEHTKRLQQGKVYNITVTGQGFGPEVQVMDGTMSVATAIHGRWFGFGPDAEFVTSLTFAPTRTTDYRILVVAGPVVEQRRAPLSFTIQVVELKVELSVTSQLSQKDPPYPGRGGPHKVHSIKLEGGKNYQIDMMSLAFDAFLFLEDSAGNVLTQDDDSGGGLNARIVYRPTKTATYRIVATTFDRTAKAKTAGAYTLRVVENPHAQPKFANPPLSGTSWPIIPKD
jgi:hypothetical protein